MVSYSIKYSIPNTHYPPIGAPGAPDHPTAAKDEFAHPEAQDTFRPAGSGLFWKG